MLGTKPSQSRTSCKVSLTSCEASSSQSCSPLINGSCLGSSGSQRPQKHLSSQCPHSSSQAMSLLPPPGLLEQTTFLVYKPDPALIACVFSGFVCFFFDPINRNPSYTQLGLRELRATAHKATFSMNHDIHPNQKQRCFHAKYNQDV